MYRPWSRVLLALCALLPCAPLPAATYYVAQRQAGAADTNPGSRQRPFRTIGAALARLQPGDSLLLGDGVYREAVVKADDAFAASVARTTLAAAPGCRPVIKGSEVLAGPWTRLPGNRPVYVLPRDAYTQMLFVDEQPLRQIGLQGSPQRAAATNGFQLKQQWRGKGLADLIAGSFYYDAPGKRLYAWLPEGADPRKHTVEAAVRADGVTLRGTWTLRGLKVCHIADGFWPHEQAVAVAGDRCVVEDCRLLHNDLLGLVVSGADCVIRGNEIGYSGLMGLTSNVGYRMLVEGNQLHHNSTRGDVVCLTAGNKLVFWRDCTFRRNWWHDETGTALWLDISDGNNLIAENRFDNCACGIYIEISRWAVVANNVLRNCGRGLWSYSSDVLIAHNVLDRCPEGIIVSGYPRLCNENQSTGEPNRMALLAVRNNLVVNNLLLDAVGAYVGITPDDGYAGDNWSDHNAFVWTLPTSHATGMHLNFMSGWDALYGKLPIWWQERGQDEHSVVADAALRRQLEEGSPWIGLPREQLFSEAGLVDRAKGDYALQPSSPLRGTGVRLPETLNSPYRPGAGRSVVSRQWAQTLLAAAPAALQGREVTRVGEGHYRLQPLPALRPLVELDGLTADDPGLNARWQQTGRYPAFEAAAEPEQAAPDAWAVYPSNRLQDPSFALGMSKPGDEAPGRPWQSRGGVQVFAGVACANLLPEHQQPAPAFQRVGKIAPNCEYLLWGSVSARSLDSRFAARGLLYLAAGEALEPLGRPALAEGKPSRGSGHWRTVCTRYLSPRPGEAPVGQDLYVVLGAAVNGPAEARVEALAAQVRWDNLVLLSGEAP